MDRHGYLSWRRVGGQINRLRRCQGSIASTLNLAFQRAASASTTVDTDFAYDSLIRPGLGSLQISATRRQTGAVDNAESRGLRWAVRPHLSIPSPESTIRRSARLPLGTRVFHTMVTSRSHRGSGVACIRFTAKMMVSTSSKDIGTQYNSRVRILLVIQAWSILAAYPCLDLPSLLLRPSRLLERSTKRNNRWQRWFVDVSFYLFPVSACWTVPPPLNQCPPPPGERGAARV